METTGAHAAAVERRILAHEHRQLEPLVERLETVAGLAGPLSAAELAGALRSLLDGLEKTLLPHMAWEEQFCYPEFERLAGTSWATRYLRIQHQQIHDRLNQLEADWLLLRGGQEHHAHVDLRRHLHETHALLCSHMEQDEQALLPFCEGEHDAAAGPLTG